MRIELSGGGTPRGPWQRNSFGRCLTTCNPDSRSPATDEADRYGQRRSGLHALLGQRAVALRPRCPYCPRALRCLFGPYTSTQTKKNMNLFFPKLVMWGGGAVGARGAEPTVQGSQSLASVFLRPQRLIRPSVEAYSRVPHMLHLSAVPQAYLARRGFPRRA